jgi:hypothetical protein
MPTRLPVLPAITDQPRTSRLVLGSDLVLLVRPTPITEQLTPSATTTHRHWQVLATDATGAELGLLASVTTEPDGAALALYAALAQRTFAIWAQVTHHAG